MATIVFITSFLFEAKKYKWQRLSPKYFLCSTEMLATIPRNFSQQCFTDIYQVSDVRETGGELPHSLPLPLPVLVRVNVEINRAVEGGQQVAEAGHVRQPDRPD